eukprot:223073-Hanusia_phi.AAC.1
MDNRVDRGLPVKGESAEARRQHAGSKGKAPGEAARDALALGVCVRVGISAVDSTRHSFQLRQPSHVLRWLSASAIIHHGENLLPMLRWRLFLIGVSQCIAMGPPNSTTIQQSDPTAASYTQSNGQINTLSGPIPFQLSADNIFI